MGLTELLDSSHVRRVRMRSEVSPFAQLVHRRLDALAPQRIQLLLERLPDEEFHVIESVHPGSSRDQMSDDDIFLQALEIVPGAMHGHFYWMTRRRRRGTRWAHIDVRPWRFSLSERGAHHEIWGS